MSDPVRAAGEGEIDPVTLEVLNNRLHEISREAGATLTRTAASPVTAEAKDLGFNLTTPAGENVVFSTWMPRHGTTLAHMVRSSMEQLGDDPGIDEGDMIMTNDPHAGALHIMDVAVLAPVHYDGELVAWVGCATHHRDVGAMTTGWPTRATDWYQEGVKYPPIKLVEGGEIRTDVFELFLRNVRIPKYQGLDLKAQIAANNVARERLRETIDEYGIGTLKACYEEMIEYGERTARDRFEALPDGEYAHVDYLDYDDLYRIECTLTVDGDELRFDFSGTAEQAPSFVNCAYPSAEANLHNILLVTMFPDVTVNQGTFRPVDVDIPEGTLFNCTPPAPCAGASIYGGRRVQSLSNAVLAKAFVETDDPSRASAEWGGGSPSVQITGEAADGEPFTAFVMDQSMLGGGARYDKDGANTTNILASTNTSIPNVEYYEERLPVLYQQRSLRADSGGPGARRGGLGGEFAFTVRGVDGITVNPFQHRKDVPPFGLFGGYPGRGGVIERYEIGHRPAPEVDLDGAEPAETYGQQNEEFTLTPSELVHVCCPAGGGIGDPLARDPGAVAEDVRRGTVSVEQAEERYGVVFEEGASAPTPDADATATRRADCRERRAAAARDDPDAAELSATCDDCGGRLFVRSVSPAARGYDADDERVRFEETVCVECGALEDVRTTVVGDEW